MLIFTIAVVAIVVAFLFLLLFYLLLLLRCMQKHVRNSQLQRICHCCNLLLNAAGFALRHHCFVAVHLQLYLSLFPLHFAAARIYFHFLPYIRYSTFCCLICSGWVLVCAVMALLLFVVVVAFIASAAARCWRYSLLLFALLYLFLVLTFVVVSIVIVIVVVFPTAWASSNCKRYANENETCDSRILFVCLVFVFYIILLLLF